MNMDAITKERFEALLPVADRIIRGKYTYFKTAYADRDDLHQAARLAAKEAAESYIEGLGASLSTHGHRVISGRIVDALRRYPEFSRCEDKKTFAHSIERITPSNEYKIDQISVKNQSYDEAIYAVIVADLLWKSIGELPDNQKVTISLFLFSGFLGPAISEIMGVSERSISKYRKMGIENLQKSMASVKFDDVDVLRVLSLL
jgi:RNA polymerase sigma factor (sigma-70 family)